MQEYSPLNSYATATPAAPQDCSSRTLVDILSESARARPYRNFLFCQGVKMEYDAFWRESGALANALATIGIVKGERVALLLPNSVQLLLGLLGAWQAGAVVCPLNPYLDEAAMAQALRAINPTAVMVVNSLYTTVKKAQPASCQTVVVTGLHDYLSPLAGVFHRLSARDGNTDRLTLQEGDYCWLDLQCKHRKAGRSPLAVAPVDPAVLFYAESMRSPALFTHGTLVLAAQQARSWMGGELEEWDDRIALALPLREAPGCITALGLALVNRSSCVMIGEETGTDSVLRELRKRRPVLMFAAPDMCDAILDYVQKTGSKSPLNSIKLCAMGGSMLAPEMIERFERLTGGRLLDGHVLTADALRLVSIG